VSTVARVATRPFQLALKGALRWGRAGELTGLSHVLVSVFDDAGNVGSAEAPVRPTIYGETVSSVEAVIRDHLAPALVGLEVADTAAQQRALTRTPNNHCAKGALDTALCELRAEAAGNTLFEAERGEADRIEVSFILGIDALDAMLAEAARIYEQGVRVFKVKVGRSAAHDAQVLGALQRTFGGAGVTLYADANEGLSPETAARELERLAKLGVAYVEEPLPVHLLKTRAALKQANILPIIADDSCFTLSDLERELDFGTFDILNIKTARTGFTASQRMLSLARSAGKGVMVGSQASAGLGTLHAAIFASKVSVTHPCELSFPLKLETDVLNAPLTFAGGFLEVSRLKNLHLSPAFAPT
jgi:L-alanine-DL-glutamate epimerase-like enolase superfamily enzyme